MSSHQFANMADARIYALAGNATITLESAKTGAHFTYKIRQALDKETGEPVAGLHFVSLLAGADNEADYVYLGIIRNLTAFSLTKASKAGEDAPSVKAFRYFWNARELPPALTVRHEGSCGRCGRKLTVPESIDRGIGPECAKHFSNGMEYSQEAA